jgi:hypothetical protein
MGTRGRRSSASLTVINAVGAFERLQPGPELTAEQAEVWRLTVNGRAPDWFREEHRPVLTQYCRHVDATRLLGLAIEDLLKRFELNRADDVETVFPAKDYDRLLKCQERESRAITTLATKMRLTQQSLYDKSKKLPAQAKRPWEK